MISQSTHLVILVDDTKSLAEMYAQYLSMNGYAVTTANSAASLFTLLDQMGRGPDLLILDVRLPDIDGLTLLSQLRERGFNAPVIVITGHGSVHMAVEAMRLGAADFLLKPFPIEKLGISAARALDLEGLSTKAQATAVEDSLPEAEDNDLKLSAPRAGFGGFIGISPPMQTVYDIIENAACSNATVFITGESGTGKEICAEAIHRYSKRSQRPFIAINCAAIPRELLESELFGHVKGAFTGAVSDREGAVSQARGGTLFLDEIAEMAPDMQTKLLRFLQNLTYQKVGGNKPEKANVRIICATNRDPVAEVRDGRLRQDLYYRLHVIPIHMPPLRQRKTDIVDLADYFLKLYAREEGKAFRSLSPEAEFTLMACNWPGNVRQLQNIIRGIVVLHEGRIVGPHMLPPLLGGVDDTPAPIRVPTAAPPSPPIDGKTITPLWKVEKHAIEKAITLCAGNIPKAAALLEISPSTIYRKKMSWERGDTGSAYT